MVHKKEDIKTIIIPYDENINILYSFVESTREPILWSGFLYELKEQIGMLEKGHQIRVSFISNKDGLWQDDYVKRSNEVYYKTVDIIERFLKKQRKETCHDKKDKAK